MANELVLKKQRWGRENLKTPSGRCKEQDDWLIAWLQARRFSMRRKKKER